MRKLDLIIIICILAAALLLSVLALVLSNGGDVAVVRVDGEEIVRLPLDKDTEFTVSTKYGTNIITVQDGKAYVSESDCENGICKKSGNATDTHSVVCLPHKLIVSIEEG